MFADVLVVALFRFVRRFLRYRQAKSWPKTSATLAEWTCIQADDEYGKILSSLQVQAVFEYFVSGEKFVGLVKSVGLSEAVARGYVDEASKPTQITVRYNPSDPSQSRVLNDDNTLSFEVAIY